MIIHIYEIISPSGQLLYIGRSKSPWRRWQRFALDHAEIPCYYRITASFPVRFAKSLEKLLIQTFLPPYNKTITSHGGKYGIKPSEATKVKLRRSHLGKSHPHSEETKCLLRQSLLGHPVSKVTCKRISKATTGRIITSEHRIKLSAFFKGRVSPFKGRTHSEETRKKMRKSRRKFLKKAKTV